MTSKYLISGLALFSVLLLSSCYRVPVPQGNNLTEHKVHKIMRGMNSAMVVNLLGTPVLNNTFANGQTAYVYTYKHKNQPQIMKRLIIYFQNDRVVNISFVTNVNGQPLPPQNT